MIYFDNNATTQVAPEVFEAMRPALTVAYGNPSAAYAHGQQAKQLVDDARASVAGLLGADSPGEITFTSGGSEADNWAITGALGAGSGRDHIVTTSVEHEAVRNLCRGLEARGRRVTWLGVDEQGALDLDALKRALGKDTAVVSTMLANNETGILFPVDEIGRIVKENSDALFHVDGVNAVGKLPIDLRQTPIDLFSISGHKFHAPKGIGALYIRDGVDISPMFAGGGQERGRRAGTEAVHQIAGIGAAAELVKSMAPWPAVAAMRDRLEAAILNSIPFSYLNGSADADKRLPNTSSISFENTNGEMILECLDALGVCVSTGSACNSSSHAASPVLQAMNVPYSRAMGAIRFSLGRYNTEDEVDRVLAILPGVIGKLRSFGGAL